MLSLAGLWSPRSGATLGVLRAQHCRPRAWPVTHASLVLVTDVCQWPCVRRWKAAAPALGAIPPASGALQETLAPPGHLSPSPGWEGLQGRAPRTVQKHAHPRSQGCMRQPPVRAGPTNSDLGPAAPTRFSSSLELELPRRRKDHRTVSSERQGGIFGLPCWRARVPGLWAPWSRRKGIHGLPPQTFPQSPSLQGPSKCPALQGACDTCGTQLCPRAPAATPIPPGASAPSANSCCATPGR